MQLAHVAPTPTSVPKPIVPPAASPPDAASAPGTAASFILFGRDQRGRPHAASLAGYETAVVERVADTDALRSLAAKLPVGRIFPKSGKMLAPFCSGATFDQLLAAAGIADAPRPVKAAGKLAEAGGSGVGGHSRGAGGSGAGDPPATRLGATKAPADHSEICIGCIVLADDEEGYYAAKVILTRADDQFVLQWVNYPDLPEFTRSRQALAILHPDAVAAAG